MPATENKQAVRRMMKAFNTGDLSIVDELLAPSHKDLTPFPGTGPSAEGLKKQIAHIRQAFPDVKFTIEKMVAEGETVAFRWKMVGSQKGEFLGNPASNKKIEHFGNDIVTFRRGKMIEHRSTDDHLELVAKCGHEPRIRVNKL